MQIAGFSLNNLPICDKDCDVFLLIHLPDTPGFASQNWITYFCTQFAEHCTGVQASVAAFREAQQRPAKNQKLSK
jgi:hypothetical protein